MTDGFDRLVEVWAANSEGEGCSASGWVLGDRAVLTASHVLRRFSANDGVIEVRRADLADDVRWYRCAVSYSSDLEFGKEADSPDLALLHIIDSSWRPPRSRHPKLADLGSRIEEAEAIGFPESEVRSDELRLPEHPKGVLEPGGAPRRGLVPFDIGTSVPMASALWQGFSGAAVRDGSDRIVGVVKGTVPDHQSRRLFVSPVAALRGSELFAACLREFLRDATIEVAEAPQWREHLAVLELDGGLPRVMDADMSALGVKQVRPIRGSSSASPIRYIRRRSDDELDAGLRRALEACAQHTLAGRMILVFGDSGAGKSRAAVEALQRHETLRARRVLVPGWNRPISDLADAGVDGRLDLRDCVLWLDDVHHYIEGAGLERSVAARLLTEQPDLILVATINQHELAALQPVGELRPKGWDLIGDRELVDRVAVERQWSVEDRNHAVQLLDNAELRRAVERGVGIGEWLIAGPDLVTRLEMATREQRLLVDAVIDWHRAGRPDPLPVNLADTLWVTAFEEDGYEPEIPFSSALEWAKMRVLRQALVSERDGGLMVHDYVAGHLARADPGRPIAERIWASALSTVDQVPDPRAARYRIAVTAHFMDNEQRVIDAIKPLAENGDRNAYGLLGAAYDDLNRPHEAEFWYGRAAMSGNEDAALKLGDLLSGLLRFEEAEDWYLRLADAGNGWAMLRLSFLWWTVGRNQDSAAMSKRVENAMTATNGPFGAALKRGVEQERWFGRVAAAGNPRAMFRLARHLQVKGQASEAEKLYRMAAERGDTDAMVNLGVLLHEEGHIQEAWRWTKRAAIAGDSDALRNLGQFAHAADVTHEPPQSEAGRDPGLEDAIAENRRLLAERTQVLGADHPETLSTRREVAALLANIGALEESITEFGSLLADRERLLGPDHSNTLATREDLADVLAMAGCVDLAIADYQELLYDRQRLLGADDPVVLATRYWLAHYLVIAGRVDEAIAENRHLLAERTRVLGANHPDTLSTRAILTTLTAREGRGEER